MPSWLGLVQYGVCSLCILDLLFLMCSRIKQKLHSGALAISGDHWPIFLYQGYAYDPEDPWNGLFQSTILVSASLGRI